MVVHGLPVVSEGAGDRAATGLARQEGVHEAPGLFVFDLAPHRRLVGVHGHVEQGGPALSEHLGHGRLETAGLVDLYPEALARLSPGCKVEAAFVALLSTYVAKAVHGVFRSEPTAVRYPVRKSVAR